MPRSPARSGLPLAGEPILTSVDALRVVSMAIHRPLEAETIAFFLDDGSRSNTITIVSGTTEPDSIISVAECMAVAASRSPTLCGVVLASVRPDTLGLLAGDIDRWLVVDAITEAHGIELVDWFIVDSAGVECPRDVLGEAERW
jgi:hypothetical protein